MIAITKHISFVVITSVFFSCADTSSREEEPVEPSPVTSIVPDGKYMMQGKIIAQTIGNTLQKKLETGLLQKGVSQTLLYCNVNALPIIDSLANMYQVKIRRTSLKYRNELNRPNEQEKLVFNTYSKVNQNGQLLHPIIQNTKEQGVVFYAPIFTNGLCLNCHGTPGKELLTENHDLIKELYPKDLATGYRINELRGMWVIEFPKQ